jgi:adenine-specific DNA-methyltransferase
VRSRSRPTRSSGRSRGSTEAAENYHALQALLFSDYVEGDDLYRHSKWLAFMERRLLLAKELLNPEDSVLVVTIDEKEYLRLGLLLEQLFPGVARQMVTIVINPNGVARGRELARVEEYAFFLFLGNAGPALVSDSLLDTGTRVNASTEAVRWERLMRGGSNSRRQDRPNLFFPVFIDPESRTVVDVGEALPLGVPVDSVSERSGLVTVWPIRSSGEEANWRTSPEYLRELLKAGYARVGSYDARNDRWSLGYLGKAQIRRIEAGDIRIVGRAADGSVQLEAAATETRRTAKTVWNRPAHKAGEYGSALVKKFTGNRAFPFPKSLYAVEDALRVAVGDRPDATIIDFFAGSGTTAHAVMRLNRQDGGRRQSITITNNEVSADQQRSLRAKGLRPGDAEWEEHGICDYITKPRLQAAITGRTPDGASIKGDYRFTDAFAMADGFEENVEFFTLTYEAPLRVASHRDFERIAPLLWLRAGSRGRRIDDVTKGWDVAEAYGVLADLDEIEPFLKAVVEQDGLEVAFIVTDEDRLFESVVRELPEHVEPVRLYEAYLRNFEIESGRGLR